MTLETELNYTTTPSSSPSPSSSEAADAAGSGSGSGSAEAFIEVFVPGRICLFGEHSDWAGGFRRENPSIPVGRCLISGTNQGLFAKASTKRDGILYLYSTLDHGETMQAIIRTEDELLAEATSNSLWSYICGTYHQVRAKHPTVNGLVLDNYKTTLPVKKGLSSSAAVCVLTARALSRLYHLNLSKRDEMEFAYLGETMTPSKCGRMDQGCAYGSGRPILMTFDADDLTVQEDVPIAAPLHLVLVDLCAAKNTPAILADLRRAYPEATCDTTRGVQALLGSVNHQIMEAALKALRDGCPRSVGACMTRAQEEFDKYAIPASPEHLTSPTLHELLAHPQLMPLVYGGKGVGSQGDGSAQFVAKSERDQADAIQLIERDFGMTCLPLTLGDKQQRSKT